MTQENIFIVCMGVSTVFVGLVCIVVLCKILSALCSIKKSDVIKKDIPHATTTSTKPQIIENRQEIIAAVTAVCAEEMGADVSALRVISFKKI